jgi:acyl-coenzyme A thioesterase PaaI-like protein
VNPSAAAGEPEPRPRQHLYAHLGISMGATGELTSAGRMPVGPDIVTPGGIRAALLALLVEGGFGANFLDAGLFPVLDNMTVHVRDGGDGVAYAQADGEIVRPGSRRAVARGRVVDADVPSRLLAYAHIGYWMIQPRDEYMPRGTPRTAVDDGERTPPTESILDAMEMQVQPETGACELLAVHPGVQAPEGRLHGGAHQLMHEAAALAGAARTVDTDRLRVEDFSIRFLAPAFAGPFVATPTVLSTSPDDLLCQVELVDRGADDRIRSLSTLRIRVLDGPSDDRR